MKIVNFAEMNSELNRFVAEIRDIHIQQDRLRFRKNLERIGEVMSYEISKDFRYSEKLVTTPLGTARVNTADDKIVIGTILRAGIPYHQGFLNYFDRAENAFVSAYRKYKDKLNFEIFIEYIASPRIDGKILILTDPMLATGGSMELSYRALLTKGEPEHIHIASVIASQKAIEYITTHFPEEKTTVWVGAIDPDLNEHSYRTRIGRCRRSGLR